MVKGFRFRIQGLGSGFRVQGIGFWVYDSGPRIYGSGLYVQALGFGV